MKNLYVCEKCGAQFEDYDSCFKCEESHININDYQEIPDTAPTWKQGSIMPETVVLKSASIWNQETQEYEQKYATYKLLKMLTRKECEKIEEAAKMRREEQERQWQEFHAKQEQRKAEEQRKTEEGGNA